MWTPLGFSKLKANSSFDSIRSPPTDMHSWHYILLCWCLHMWEAKIWEHLLTQYWSVVGFLSLSLFHTHNTNTQTDTHTQTHTHTVLASSAILHLGQDKLCNGNVCVSHSKSNAVLFMLTPYSQNNTSMLQDMLGITAAEVSRYTVGE